MGHTDFCVLEVEANSSRTRHYFRNRQAS